MSRGFFVVGQGAYWSRRTLASAGSMNLATKDIPFIKDQLGEWSAEASIFFCRLRFVVARNYSPGVPPTSAPALDDIVVSHRDRNTATLAAYSAGADSYREITEQWYPFGNGGLHCALRDTTKRQHLPCVYLFGPNAQVSGGQYGAPFAQKWRSHAQKGAECWTSE